MIKKLLNISIIVAIIIFLSEFNIAEGQVNTGYPHNYLNDVYDDYYAERDQLERDITRKQMELIRINNEINRAKMGQNARIAQENQIRYRNNTNTINTLNHGFNTITNIIRQIKILSK